MGTPAAMMFAPSEGGVFRVGRGIVASALMALLIGWAATPASAMANRNGNGPAVALRGPTLPTSGAYWGAYVPLGTKYGSNRVLATQAYEAEVGRKQVLDREYYSWDTVWPQGWDYWARDQGHLLLISWNAYKVNGTAAKWADIAAGVYDADIDRRAGAIKAFAAPLFFIFNHEPEPKVGQPDPPGTPADFVAAWKHIHDRFVTDGVTNISYVLTLLNSDVDVGVAESYYPGSSYVDVIAADGYNWYGCPGRNDPWNTFSDIFTDFYNWTLVKGKPMFVAETGVQEDSHDPNHKAAWITDMAAQVKLMPNLKGVAYYNNGPPGPTCTWYVDSSTASLTAYKAMGADSYFNPAYTPPVPTGYTYVGVVDNTFGIPAGTIVQGTTIQFVFGGPSNHSVTDSSGMGYFDSGSLGANTFFKFAFPGAGNYNYKCTLHTGMTQVIKVPLVISPLSGNLSTVFTVTWASATAPTGYTYNVQIQRPGQTTWVGWKTNQTGKSATFVADTGKGSYNFRAQLKKTSNGLGSGYSVVVSIVVS